jgi:hypothetical protein
MAGIITIFQVLGGFLGLCLVMGVILYILLDLRPWRRDSLLWDQENGPAPVILKYKKIAQQNFFNRNTKNHIKSYYMYYGLAIILIGSAVI